MTGRDAEREQLAAAVLPLLPHSVGCHAHGADCICVNRRTMRAAELADALLPVVDRIANERAAAELEAAADALGDAGAWLRARAAGLRADGTTT